MLQCWLNSRAARSADCAKVKSSWRLTSRPQQVSLKLWGWLQLHGYTHQAVPPVVIGLPNKESEFTRAQTYAQQPS